MATLQQAQQEQTGLGSRKSNHCHPSFIATKTIANVLANVKPTASNRQLADLPISATVEQAFDLLLAEDILSLPVYRLDDQQKKVYVTIISVLDLMRLLSQHATDADFFQHSIKEAIGQTEESSRLVTVQYSDSLKDVLSLFSEHGGHRVLVSSKDGQQPPILLSQMDVVRYLQAHNHQLGAILNENVPALVEKASLRRQKRLHLQNDQQQQQQHLVTFKTTAIKAFEQMAHDPFISALPIVDDEDCLVGDISPQDLRGLNKARLQDLSKPVLMFLKSSHGDLVAPHTCHDRFTLSQIMAAFVLRKASRLWWTDQDEHVISVITLTDVLGSFLDDSFIC
ncbi:hypothetical protein BCR42DRAFT_421824 [Absidia repens]|uniref:CBS domain-containing protein n=1 Tax=Absidia repens TaxID=90262 RepID=A0A1X2I809_9FUNG|nr:hypothetical protein BCR42DRAFT_421824 [Absidia repens]